MQRLTTVIATALMAQFTCSAFAQRSYGGAERLVGKTFSTTDVRPKSGPATAGDFGFPNPSTPKPSRLKSAFNSAKSTFASTFSADPRVQPTGGDPTRLNANPGQVANDVYIRYADLMVQSGKAKDALAYYQVVLARDPNSLEALVGVARANDRLRDFDGAWRAYMVAVQAHPSNPLVHNDLGMCCARNGRVEPSVKAFSKAVELNPRKELYRNNLARSLVMAGRSSEGLQQLLALNPPAVAHYNFAYLLDQQGDKEQARFHLRQSLRLDPSLVQARRMFQQLGGAPRPNTANVPSPLHVMRERPNVTRPQGAPPAIERMPRVNSADLNAGDAAFAPRTSNLRGPQYLPRAAY